MLYLSDSESDADKKLPASRSARGTQGTARGDSTSSSGAAAHRAACRRLPNDFHRLRSQAEDKIPATELSAIHRVVNMIRRDDNRLQASQVDMNEMIVLPGRHQTKTKIRRGFKVAQGILHSWVHNRAQTDEHKWGRAFLCNHLERVLQTLMTSLSGSGVVEYPLLAYLW